VVLQQEESGFTVEVFTDNAKLAEKLK